MKPDVIFKCRKCGHNLYVEKNEPEKIYSLPDFNCPSCGEEGYENWIIVGQGNYENVRK